MPVAATNTAANSALFYLNRNSENQTDALNKISSGSRIVSASDDAAGLAVADQLNADITTLETAAKTADQVDALLQIADGGLQRVAEILQRVKALSTQFASGTVDGTSQNFIEDEYDALKTEIDLIANSTEYNGQVLLEGNYDETVIVGVNEDHTIDVNLAAVDVTVATLALAADLTDDAGATDFPLIDAAITAVSTARAEVGALQQSVGYQGEVIDTQIQNLQTAKSSISDADIAAEQTNFTNYQVLTEAAISGLASANEMKSSLLTLLR